MNIAIIGTGISGLAAAWCLARRHAVTLYEKDPHPGGHCRTVEVRIARGTLAIDTGFIVCNPVNYPNFYHLLDELGVARQDSDMSLGVSVADGAVEWCGSDNPLQLFAQPRLLFSARHLSMLGAVLRFNRQCKSLLARDALPAIALGDFLDRHGYPAAFKLRYVAAMAGPIWSASTREVMAFPFPAFVRFFAAHGLLNVWQRPRWQTVAGGSRVYVERLLAEFVSRGGVLRLGCNVRKLQRTARGVDLHDGTDSARYDAVVCAAHADQALRLTADASAEERAVLAAIPYTRNTAALHTDASLMPRRRAAWGAWNALLAQDALSDAPIAVSYWMNRLQRLPGERDYFVSLNPPRPPRPETVLFQTEFEHPQYGATALAAWERLPTIQGRGGLWWAGAWCGYGFHEDGLKSALACVAGIDRDCLPRWARPAAADKATADDRSLAQRALEQA